MTDEQQDAPADEAETPDAGGDDEALDVSALMDDGEGGGASEPGDPDAPGVISAEALLEDPGAPETRAPEEIATGEARAQAAAEAGAAAAGGQAPAPQEEANTEAEGDGAAVSEGDEASSEPVDEAQAPAEPEAEAPAEPEAEAPADDSGGDDDTPEMDPAVQEYIGQDSTVVHHSSGKDEHGLPTEFRTPPGIAGGIDPGTLADRDKKV
jgi:hypothetical protein